MEPAQREQLADLCPSPRVRLHVAFVPAELRGEEGRPGVRVGDALAGQRIAERGEAGELGAPPLGDGGRELAGEVAEEGERRRRLELLAHEEHRHVRCQQQARVGSIEQRAVGEHGDALAERAIADLVVRLQRRDEGDQRQRCARLAACRALAIRRRLPLVGEALARARGPACRADRPRSRRSSRRFRRSAAHGLHDGGRRSTGRSPRAARRRGRGRAGRPRWRRSRATTWTCRARPGPSRSAVQISRTIGSAESSRIAWIASMRRPSARNSSTQYSALWTKKSRTVRDPVAVEVDRRAPRRLRAPD